MNYLLPVQVGAPDYLGLLNKQITCFYSIDTNNNKFNLSSDLSQIKVNTTNSIGSYLAGLFEIVKFSNDELIVNTKESSSIQKKNRVRKYITEGIDKIPSSTNEIIIGLLLGDAHGSKASSKNTRLLFEQGEVHHDYLLHLYDLFTDYCKTGPKIYSRFDKRVNKTYSTIKFSTLTSPLFNYYFETFYLNGKKVIPANLGELLTARGLAYWSMDDGNKTGTGFRLNTQSFSKDENLLLIKILKDNFDLDCTLNTNSKNQHRIYILTKSMNKFKDLVSPYFHKSMLYKLTEKEKENNSESPSFNSRRGKGR